MVTAAAVTGQGEALELRAVAGADREALERT